MTDEIHRIRFVVGYDEITLYMHVEYVEVPYWALAATYPLHSLRGGHSEVLVYTCMNTKCVKRRSTFSHDCIKQGMRLGV